MERYGGVIEGEIHLKLTTLLNSLKTKTWTNDIKMLKGKWLHMLCSQYYYHYVHMYDKHMRRMNASYLSVNRGFKVHVRAPEVNCPLKRR